MRDAKPNSTGSRPGRAWFSAALGGVCVVAVGLTGCATTVDGRGTAAPGEVAAYQADLSASRAAEVASDGAALCRVAMSSMVVMVRGYNEFVRKLNEVQSYDKLGGLDDTARASLIAGADLIRKEITSTTPTDLAEVTNRFLDSTGRLGTAIARQQLVGLNPVSAQWTQDKQAVLDSCATYLPLPPTDGASAAPAPSGRAPS
ncbi:hypothetical protein [Gordonia rhizosphera]|uniref:Lipoprotein n=1 Tax=Gordonia rhizosphera NBRC 16068 TaxID=1108045 RepID=K6WEB7_9ACTN|nr:hypothetical protein [Gordonia rhizosphera]GAB90532.1 hypothetical protein GORHZ_105_00030 [Gordonia rhizosphera NBRC 16068]